MKKNKKALYEIISDPNIEVVSFDVFDTLILRPFFFPSDLFLFLDRKASLLYHVPDIIDFSSYRKEAEHFARAEKQENGFEDVTLEEIYTYISVHYPFSEDIIQQLMKHEIELETRFCAPRQFGVELLQFAISKGKRVIINSDMYMSSQVIGSILAKFGIVGYEKIYISSETRRTKRTGMQFDYIEQDIGVKGVNIVHVGDDIVSDYIVPRSKGWRAFHIQKTTDLLQNKAGGSRTGDSFYHSFKTMSSSQPAFHALDYLGMRCMLAVVANRVFDDPFAVRITHGDYSGSIELFGNLALGMYCLAQGLWIANIAADEGADRILFFSRDGRIPYEVYSMIQKYINLPESTYMHISRKAILPLLLSEKTRMLTVGSHLRFHTHSRESLTSILLPVLHEVKLQKMREENINVWKTKLKSESELLLFLEKLRNRALDNTKMKEYTEGFLQYFGSSLNGKILSYDIGYSLRNESILKSFFPDVDITACFTHTSKDIPIRRSKQCGAKIRTFMNTSPYVSWLVRECFLTADEPSCVGYTVNGEPQYEEKRPRPKNIGVIQDKALQYAEHFIDIFKEDIIWLPIELEDACLPFESFIHSPRRSDIKWIGTLYAENDADPEINNLEVMEFWKKLRTEYWISRHHFGKFWRHVARFFMLSLVDRKELFDLTKKRLNRMLSKGKKHGS